MKYNGNSKYQLRNFASDDFEAIMSLEEQIFSEVGETVLGPYYLRLCCDYFRETCFMVEVAGRPVGYLLCFVREREAYCTTVAVHRDYQGTRVVVMLLRALAGALAERVDSCWFTVKQDNAAARSLHAVLGGEERGLGRDFYGAGDDRIGSRLDARALERMRGKCERLGVLERDPVLNRGPLATGIDASPGAD